MCGGGLSSVEAEQQLKFRNGVMSRHLLRELKPVKGRPGRRACGGGNDEGTYRYR